MTPLPGPDPAILDAIRVVGEDRACRQCGYNIRGLRTDGRCPECGRPVGLSIYGDLLKFSDPTYVRGLARGALLILYGIAFMFIAIVGIVIVLIALHNASLAKVLMLLATLVGSLLHFAGAWLLTEPDPSGIGEDQYGNSRKLIRIALMVGIVNTLLQLPTSLSTLPPSLHLLVQIFSGLAGLVSLVGYIAMLHYLSKLAMRGPDFQRAKRADFLKYALPISYGVIIVFGMITGILTGAARNNPGAAGGAAAIMLAGGCFTMIAVICLAVFGFMYLFLIEKLGRLFGEQADMAEALWSRHPTT